MKVSGIEFQYVEGIIGHKKSPYMVLCNLRMIMDQYKMKIEITYKF
jgi:hypothetical protein